MTVCADYKSRVDNIANLAKRMPPVIHKNSVEIAEDYVAFLQKELGNLLESIQDCEKHFYG